MLSYYLPAAPAVLLGACQRLGVDATYIDFNQSINNAAERVLESNPKLVALSVFSYKSQQYARQLAQNLKQLDSTVKIIIGGSGIKTSINGNLNYINELIAENLIDYYIEGDAELSWPTFLIDFFKLTQTNEVEYLPDYSKYDIEWYRQSANASNCKVHVPVTGSKGCVRRCTFCEIPDRWDFNQRSPNQIADEITAILKLVPDAHIHFTDSLVNGSLPTFDSLLDQLIEIKKLNPDMSWSGQFIIRKKSTEDYWRKIAQSGVTLLEIGVETGSDRLRKEMAKHFTNDDLDHSLKYMEQFGIGCVLMMFVGYPSETQQDFEQTLLMLDRYQIYAGNVVKALQLGYNFSIHPGTQIYRISKQEKSPIISTKDPIVWFNKDNPTLTFLARNQRRQQLQDRAKLLGYTLSYDNEIAINDASTTYQQYAGVINLIERQR